MRLIDADKIVLDYGGLAKIHIYDFQGIAKYFYDQIQKAPTVDAVEVVRCRDCKHYGGKWFCKISGVPSRRPCDFCSHGERKNGDVDG